MRRSRGLSLSLPGSRVPANEHNTAYKAALAFFHGTGLLAGAAITVEKHVPVRAGMAGGSADAAAVLVGLNELYGARLSAAELCALGAQVGADVPFSIVGGTARVTGVGDILEPLKPCPPCFFTVCMPAGGISTPQAYARYDRIVPTCVRTARAAAAAIARGDLAGLCAQMKNALEYSSASAATKPICETLRAHGALGSADDGQRGGGVRRVCRRGPGPGRESGAAAGLPTVLGAAAGGERCARRGARMRIKRCGNRKTGGAVPWKQNASWMYWPILRGR